MSVSLSPCIKSNYNFKAQSQNTNVLDSVIAGKTPMNPSRVRPKLEQDERTLTEDEKREIYSKRIKNVVKYLLAVVVFVDIIYFVMKRKNKISKYKASVEAYNAKEKNKLVNAPKKDEDLREIFREYHEHGAKSAREAIEAVARRKAAKAQKQQAKATMPTPPPKFPSNPIDDVPVIQRNSLDGFMNF